jgi:UDPglucose 6-dehydrogenase
MAKSPTVSVVGLGYVGLSTAACFASRGIRVVGMDVDQRRLDALRHGETPIHEKGLAPLLRRALSKEMFTLTSEYGGVADSTFIFITVGTPSRDDGSIDTKYVAAASEAIGKELGRAVGYRVVVVKSTVIPGTTEGLVLPLLELQSGKKPGAGFGLASNPEFLHEGSAVEETFHPDALLIGGHDKRSSEALLKLYRKFYGKLPQTIVTTPSNAEMTKYAINSGRAAQLSFVNTIANLCTRVPGCDYDEVRKGLLTVAKMDARYLNAGLGFGGSCLGKDSRAIASFSRSLGVDNRMVASALDINKTQPEEAVKMAEKSLGSLVGKKVSVLGLSFKAGSDDTRESVAVSLARRLAGTGASVSVYDPVAMANARDLLGSTVTYADNVKDCLRGSVCAFVATAWDEFKRLRPADFKSLMASPILIDGRRIYETAAFRRAGIKIATLGTGPHPGE